MPKVWNKSDKNVPADAVFIGRGTKWGNPWPIDITHSRDWVCDTFEAVILPGLDVAELRGKDLVCFCKPKRCHGDAILRKANG